ncbi:MAG: S-layer homology domain-containing protein, partial [Bacillota bacterium]|nr:S-layer homology domain-containing protein [Bacillota bacterium]
MRGKKSPMIMGLIGAMLLSTSAFAAVPSDFSDFPTDWSAPAMTHAVQNGLLNGSDGKILPKGLLTRAQMATMVNRAFASSAKASLTSFTDMVPGVWHYDEMAKSVQMGAFQGADGKLSPNDPITREQAFAVLARAFGLADGKVSSLDKFSDGAQVSSWARGAVAALVEQGYVTGADGALNPQSYITRAEFAQVMDALVAAYADQDLKDQTVEGNLILRTNSTLENVTVKGDLILADGVSAASLKNVTVTGRLVVRGGTDGVKLTKSTAKGGIQLANPNGTPKLTIDGKAYDPNGTTNGGASNSGGGSSSGGSSGGGSSSSGGGSSSGGNSSTTQGTIVKADKTKVITTDAGTWLPLVFETGYMKDNTTVTVDGQNVTTYVTNVTTEGTIAKLPLVGQPGTVTLTSNGKTQTITIGTVPTSGSAVYTGAGYLPDYYLGHTSLALWDYYLTNYDDEGNARVLPKQTTFSTTPAKNEHPSYSPVTKLNEDNTSGNVVIMFNYKNSAAKDGDKAWFDNIAREGALELVQYDQYKTVLNSHLTYTKDKATHNGGVVGTLTIPFNQSNFTSNGRYYIRVASTTTDGKKSYALVPIHVVNHDAPEFAVKETPESGRNLHFSVKNMVYGITDPIEEVTLTKPDKTTVTLN